MKLFVQIKIPFEVHVGAVILQATNKRVQKQNYRKIIQYSVAILWRWYMLMLYFYLYMQYPACIIHFIQSFNAIPT